ncbi:MAG: molybdopterin-dependent oxidoreductase, partial [Methyloprofundus sp.]|nr:molybdopterin-dependent oxidoreductase [Methyloprofundus sp.]
FDAIYDGKVKAVWIMGTNPVVSMPNADKVKQALQQCDFVVVSDCIAETDTTALAHVKLPALGWSEKDGTVTNSERRISRQRALFEPAGSAKPDWWIVTQVARRMGFEKAFHYSSNVEIFREHAALSGFENNAQQHSRDFDISGFANLTQQEYDQLQPTQWPVNKQNPQGLARMFADQQFFTPSGKAQFISINPRPAGNLANKDFPIILNTGRLRDQWHTMTRTALSAKLSQHKPEPFVEIHPVDADHYKMQQNTLAVVESQWGKMIARVQIADTQQQGTLFIPMHWTAQYASQGRVGALVNPVVDPISHQPESKHTPVRIKTYQPAWYGFILSRHPLEFNHPDYLVKVKGNQFYRYELAGETMPESWQGWTKNILCSASNEKPQWQEYTDPAENKYRAARILDNQLQSMIFIAPNILLPERSWLSSLFEKPEFEKQDRLALLTGKPPLGTPDVGTIVCACFNVGEKTIQSAIKDKGLKTHQEVGKCLKAGTNCGSCIPEIKALL